MSIPLLKRKDYTSTEQASKALGLPVAHIRRMLHTGDLEGWKLTATYWIVSSKSVISYKKRKRKDKQP
jgi:hypothetical protein